MLSLANNDLMLADIAKDPAHIYFDKLRQTEPKINWLDFAAKIYKRSHSTKSITTYCKSLCVFREMCQESNKTIADVIDDIKTQQNNKQENNENGLVYEVLDTFSTYCDTTKKYAPKTTETCVQAVKRLFTFSNIDLDDKKFRDKVTMPRKSNKLDDEWPDNDILKTVLNVATLRMRGCVLTACDTGLEPADIAQLKPKYFKFDEDPIRVNTEREKTGEKIETFVSKTTADTLQQIIKQENIQPDEYIFNRKKTGLNLAVQYLRLDYNKTLAKAGLGEIVQSGPTTRYAKVQKIDGHKFGKYHFKVLKKRWFSIAVTVVPEYVAMAMLGRGAYLPQYYRQPLEKRQEFARKILHAVNIYKDKTDKKEVITEMAKVMGIDASNLDETKIAALQGLFGKLGQFATLPTDKIEHINKLLGESN